MNNLRHRKVKKLAKTEFTNLMSGRAMRPTIVTNPVAFKPECSSSEKPAEPRLKQES